MKNWIKRNLPTPVTTVLKILFQYALRLFYWTDISQLTSRFAEIITPYHCRGNRIPFEAIR